MAGDYLRKNGSDVAHIGLVVAFRGQELARCEAVD